jgi:hypothetical protein
MSYLITDYAHQRECIIARLQFEIGQAISLAASRSEGVTAAEVLIALNIIAQQWAREIHEQDVAEVTNSKD